MEHDYRIYATKERSYWGPIYWNFLYLTTMGFPVTLTPEQSREFSNLLLNFHLFLPCADCRHHYKREIKKLNVKITNKNEAMEVVMYLHNQVRLRQNKRKLTMDDIISYHYQKVEKSFSISLVVFSIVIILIMFRHNISGIVG